MKLLDLNAKNNLTEEVLQSLEQYQRELLEWQNLNTQRLNHAGRDRFSCQDRLNFLREKLKTQADYFWDLGINVY